jgi:Leucine rich repeat
VFGNSKVIDNVSEVSPRYHYHGNYNYFLQACLTNTTLHAMNRHDNVNNLEQEDNDVEEGVFIRRNWKSLRRNDDESDSPPNVPGREHRMTSTSTSNNSNLHPEISSSDIRDKNEKSSAVDCKEIINTESDRFESDQLPNAENEGDSESALSMPQLRLQERVQSTCSSFSIELLQPRQRVVKRRVSIGSPLPGAYRSSGLSDDEDIHDSHSNFSYSEEVESIEPPGNPSQENLLEHGDRHDDQNFIEELPDSFGNTHEIQPVRKRSLSPYILWTVTSILAFIIVGVGVAIFVVRRDAESNSNVCSIAETIDACSKDNDYVVEIPSCSLDHYRQLQKDFEMALDFRLPIETSCSSENLALLSLSFHFDINMSNTTKFARYGLSLLHFSTNGQRWKNRSNWLSDVFHCNWGTDHVFCSDDKVGEVTAISLSANQLEGTLPPNLLSFLPGLIYLDAQGNRLSGDIPADLFKLSTLLLRDNLLIGTLPTSFFNSITINVLSLSQNIGIVFSGGESIFIGNQWKILALGNIGFHPEGTFPTTLLNLTKLQYLDLSVSGLIGSIPSQLGLLTSLTYLDISDNLLEGTLFSELGKLTLLKELRLDINAISGFVPTEIGNLNQLMKLFLSENRIEGSLPSEIGRLTQLTSLGLGDNKFTGQMPNEISNLTRLRDFEFVPNSFVGTLPEVLCDRKASGTLEELGSIDIWTCVDNLGGLICPESAPKCCCP